MKIRELLTEDKDSVKVTLTPTGKNFFKNTYTLLNGFCNAVKKKPYKKLQTMLMDLQQLEKTHPDDKDEWKRQFNNIAEMALSIYNAYMEDVYGAAQLMRELSLNTNRYTRFDGRELNFKDREDLKIYGAVDKYLRGWNSTYQWIEYLPHEVAWLTDLLQEFGWSTRGYQMSFTKPQKFLSPNNYKFFSGSGRTIDYASLDKKFKLLDEKDGWMTVDRSTHLGRLDAIKAQSTSTDALEIK